MHIIYWYSYKPKTYPKLSRKFRGLILVFRATYRVGVVHHLQEGKKIHFLLWAPGRELCASLYACRRLLQSEITELLTKPSNAAFESFCPLSLSCCVLDPVQSSILLELVSPSDDNSSTSPTRHSPLAPWPTLLPSMTVCPSAAPHAILPISKTMHFHWNPQSALNIIPVFLTGTFFWDVTQSTLTETYWLLGWGGRFCRNVFNVLLYYTASRPTQQQSSYHLNQRWTKCGPSTFCNASRCLI